MINLNKQITLFLCIKANKMKVFGYDFQLKITKVWYLFYQNKYQKRSK